MRTAQTDSVIRQTSLHSAFRNRLIVPRSSVFYFSLCLYIALMSKANGLPSEQSERSSQCRYARHDLPSSVCLYIVHRPSHARGVTVVLRPLVHYDLKPVTCDLSLMPVF